MRLSHVVLLSVLHCSVAALSIGRELNITESVHALKYVKGGVLVKNGTLTSCELSLIDSSALVLSASCLDYTSGITLNSNTKYDIYLDQGMDGVGLHRNVDSITVHPSYNPKTFVNDIAIMQFNTNEEIIWQNAIAPVLHYSWDVIGLIRGKPSNLNQLKWEGFSYSLPQLTTNSTCTGLSEMYEANSNDLMCSHEVHDAIVLSNYTCPVPYGTAFGIINGTAHLIGPYSYTAVEGGSDLCSFTDQRSYFISLANYLKFITTTINRDVRIDSLFQFDTSKLDADYKMVDRDFKDNNGMLSTKISGDFYNRRSTTSNVNSSSEADTSLDSTTSEKSGDSSSGESSSSGGMSTKTTIIVAVCASIGGVILVSIAPFLIFWYWRRRKEMTYPIGQARYQDMIESELAGANVRGAVHTVDNADADSDPEPANQILNLYPVELPPVYEEDGSVLSGIIDKPDKTDSKSS